MITPPLPAASHRPHRQPGGIDHRREIDVDDPTPIARIVCEQVPVTDPGNVRHDVEPTTPRDGRVESRSQFDAISHVTWHEPHSLGHSCEVDRLLRTGGVQVDEGHRGAAGDQRNDGGTADP